MMIKAVFLDFYGTLAQWVPARESIQWEACKAEGLTASTEALAQAYPAADDYMARENARTPIAVRPEAERQALLAKYERVLLRAAGLEVSPEKAGRIWRRVNSAPKELGLYDDVEPALEEVLAAGLRMGIVSNMGRELDGVMDRLGLHRFIQATSTSAEAGVSKPHPAIFEAALAKAGVQPQEAIHVGDHYEGDVVGALGARMHALLLVRDSASITPAECPTITTLGELLPYLTNAGYLAAS